MCQSPGSVSSSCPRVSCFVGFFFSWSGTCDSYVSFTFLLMLESRCFLSKGYLNIKSWEICFNQVWQTDRALRDTSFVGTGWAGKRVSANAPIMEELSEPVIRGHTGREAYLCITNLQETRLLWIWVSQQYLRTRFKWSWQNAWYPVEELLSVCPLSNTGRDPLTYTWEA